MMEKPFNTRQIKSVRRAKKNKTHHQQSGRLFPNLTFVVVVAHQKLSHASIVSFGHHLATIPTVFAYAGSEEIRTIAFQNNSRSTARTFPQHQTTFANHTLVVWHVASHAILWRAVFVRQLRWQRRNARAVAHDKLRVVAKVLLHAAGQHGVHFFAVRRQTRRRFDRKLAKACVRRR